MTPTQPHGKARGWQGALLASRSLLPPTLPIFRKDQQHRRGPVLPQLYPKESPEEGDFSSQTQIHSRGSSCSKALLYAFGFLTLVSTDTIPI